MIIRFLIGLLVIVLLLGLSLVMIPVDSLLKRVTDSSGISYSLAEGNLFKGRINDLSYNPFEPFSKEKKKERKRKREREREREI